MALAGTIAGHHGNLSVPSGSPNYDFYTGELTKWTITYESVSYESTRFIADPTTSKVPFKTVEKGLYKVRGTVEGFWDTSVVGAGTSIMYEMYQADRAAVDITFISRDTGGTGTDQSQIVKCKMNNYRTTVNRQTGLISFAADILGEENVASGDIIDFT